MIYNNSKAETEAIKKFIQPQNQGGRILGEIPKARTGPASAPQNRHMPIRGQK